MKQIRLGKSELVVSRVGFGGIPITRVSSEQAERCIHAAIDLGVNFIDTATDYSDSEEKIGKAIKGCRDKLIIATKSQPKTVELMAECIDQSLGRLQMDCIDLYQFHCIKDEDTLKKSIELMPVLEKAKQQGKIKHIGATVHGVDWINRVVETDIFETVMIALNFIVCEAAEVCPA
jgi:aryl-alcohol dehydrogenase-like predicted oxidoreductase